MRLSKEYRDLVTDYCYKNPDMLTLTLAKLIYKNHPEIFSSVDNVRYMIMTRRRARGGVMGKSYDDSLIREQKPIQEWMKLVQKKPKLKKSPPAKILVFDIETAPINAYVWGLWNQNVGTNQIKSDWFMLCWSAKWLFEDKVHHDRLNSREVVKQDDKRISKSLWRLIDQADIVIAHNGDKFDIRKMNTRFILNGIKPPSPYQSIDTLKHARRRLSLSSNRLDYIAQVLGVGRKIDTGGFDLWDQSIKGNEEALKKMDEYCQRDVELLEEVYLELRPYIKPHPNIGLYIGDNLERCPSCGSENLEPRGYYYTYINQYDAFQCGNCDSWSRSRKTNTPLKDNGNVKTSLP